MRSPFEALAPTPKALFAAEPRQAAWPNSSTPLNDVLFGMAKFTVAGPPGGQKNRLVIAPDRFTYWLQPGMPRKPRLLPGALAKPSSRPPTACVASRRSMLKLGLVPSNGRLPIA